MRVVSVVGDNDGSQLERSGSGLFGLDLCWVLRLFRGSRQPLLVQKEWKVILPSRISTSALTTWVMLNLRYKWNRYFKPGCYCCYQIDVSTDICRGGKMDWVLGEVSKSISGEIVFVVAFGLDLWLTPLPFCALFEPTWSCENPLNLVVVKLIWFSYKSKKQEGIGYPKILLTAQLKMVLGKYSIFNNRREITWLPNLQDWDVGEEGQSGKFQSPQSSLLLSVKPYDCAKISNARDASHR